MFPGIVLAIAAVIFITAGYQNKNVIDVVLGLDRERSDGSPKATTTNSMGVPGVSEGQLLGSSPTAGVMVGEMDRMIALRQPYKWGGGHAHLDRNGPWDCSGAVSWLLHFIGVLDGGPRISTGFMAWGEPGQGSEFTVYSNPTHVFIKMHTGPHAGECWGTTRRIASQGGSLAWHDHTTVGFVARHPKGH